MKTLILMLFAVLLSTLFISLKIGNNLSYQQGCIIQLQSGADGDYGTPVCIMTCSAEDAKCKFVEIENTKGNTVLYQVRIDRGDWKSYMLGTYIKGKDVEARSTSAITPTTSKIKVKASCGCGCR